MNPQTSLLIVGIGSPHGDDRVGWEIANQLKSRAGMRADIRIARTPHDLLDWIDGYEQLIICDACRGAGDIGSCHRWAWPSGQLTSVRWSGTHQVSLPSVLALAAQLNLLPPEVHIRGVEIQHANPELPLSAQVAAGAERVVAEIMGELSSPTCYRESSRA